MVILTEATKKNCQEMIENWKREDEDVLELREQVVDLKVLCQQVKSDVDGREHQLKMVQKDYQDVKEKQLVNEH